MAPKKASPAYAASVGLDVPLPFPEDRALATMPDPSEIKIVKPPGVTTLREWGDQVLAGGKHVGKTFAQAPAVDASYGEFMKKKGDLTSLWALSFQNYVRAVDQANQSPKMEQRQPILTPAMIAKMKQEWAMNGAVATDWDVIEELKGSPSSEVPLRITTSASGSAATKRGPPADDNVWDMKVEISHEASLRVEQIQRQIALLQDEMRRILPAETEDA